MSTNQDTGVVSIYHKLLNLINLCDQQSPDDTFWHTYDLSKKNLTFLQRRKLLERIFFLAFKREIASSPPHAENK